MRNFACRLLSPGVIDGDLRQAGVGDGGITSDFAIIVQVTVAILGLGLQTVLALLRSRQAPDRARRSGCSPARCNMDTSTPAAAVFMGSRSRSLCCAEYAGIENIVQKSARSFMHSARALCIILSMPLIDSKVCEGASRGGLWKVVALIR